MIMAVFFDIPCGTTDGCGDTDGFGFASGSPTIIREQSEAEMADTKIPLTPDVLSITGVECLLVQ